MDGLAIFAAALTAPDRRPPMGLAGPAERRFAVYRNNVAVGLIRALETRFTAVRALVGDEFFGALARDFIRAHPPSSPLLARFGDELPAFLARFPPVAELPYLPDIARIEAARTRAYHAADEARLDASAFAIVPAGALEGLRVELHPAVSIVVSVHPVWDILAAANGGAAPVDDWTPQAVIVDRPGLDVAIHAVPPATAAFLALLGSGATLGEAAAQAATIHAGFDLPAALAALVGGALATRIHLTEGETP